MGAALSLLGCASANLGDKLQGEACTRTDQCAAGLGCVKGACEPAAVPDAGNAGSLDASSTDASADDAGHDDAGP